MSVVVRYYYNGAIHESFLHFQSAESLDAAGLTKMIIDCLEKHGLDYKNNLVGQGYDGASVMSGKHSGVSVRIKNFVSGLYVHLKWLAVQKELYPQQQPRELQRLTDVRWACRYMACRNLRDRLPAVLRLLQDIALENSGDRSPEAKGLLSQIDLHFIGLLVTFCKVLGDAKCLSDMLQSSSLDLARALELVGALTDTLHYRTTEVRVPLENYGKRLKRLQSTAK